MKTANLGSGNWLTAHAHGVTIDSKGQRREGGIRGRGYGERVFALSYCANCGVTVSVPEALCVAAE